MNKPASFAVARLSAIRVEPSVKVWDRLETSGLDWDVKFGSDSWAQLLIALGVVRLPSVSD